MNGHPGHHRVARAGTWIQTGVLAAFLLLALFPAGGCAVMPDPADKEAVAEFNEINDPAEPTNRAVFGVNRGLDSALLKPVATAYRDATPKSSRTGSTTPWITCARRLFSSTTFSRAS